MGIYFYERGASQRASKVVYDRAGSAVSLAGPEDYDWDVILIGAEWFHFTGITPALGERAAAAALAACKAAKKAGAVISCDLNYRKKLWSREKAREVMTGFAEYIDVLFANEEDAGDVFGVRSEEAGAAGFESVARQLTERFGFKKVAVTMRESVSATVNNWSGLLLDGGKTYFSKKYTINIVDRVGAGDSFAAGMIYALLEGQSPAVAVEFAAAASCLKHTVEGDFNLAGLAEIRALAGGDGTGRVQR